MRTSLVLLCLTLLVSYSLSFNILVRDQKKKDSNDDRVKIDFYYESLCPSCQSFMQKSLKTAVNTKDFLKICDIKFYPYGNARRSKVGTDDWSYTCQHGAKECQGNLIESCAIKLYPDQFETLSLPFIMCLEGNTYDFNTQGKKCATQYALNWDDINSCATSKQGRQFEAQIAEATEQLKPAHTYVPWVVVNNAHTSSSESSVESNMVKYVCSIYKGSVKIDACKK